MCNYTLHTSIHTCSVRGVPPGEFADRMSVTMTLLLTSVAFKLVTSEWVPKISYQTLLDYYNLLCILVLMTIVLENLIVALMVTYDTRPYDTVDYEDQIFFELLLAFWVILNVVIYVGYKTKFFFPHWENVVRQNLLDEGQQCLRVPKLTGNVAEETVDSTHYGLGNRHHLMTPGEDVLIWDTKTKTFKKKNKEDTKPSGGQNVGLQLKDI